MKLLLVRFECGFLHLGQEVLWLQEEIFIYSKSTSGFLLGSENMTSWGLKLTEYFDIRNFANISCRYPTTSADIIFPWTREVILTEDRNHWRVFLQDGGRKTGSNKFMLVFSLKCGSKNNNTTLSGIAERTEHRPTPGVNSICMNLHISAHKPEVVITSLGL